MSVGEGGHRIESARIARVAAQDAPKTEPQAFYGAMYLDSFNSVSGTGRVETAAGRVQRRDAALVEPYGQDEEPLCERHAVSPAGTEEETSAEE